MGSLCATLRRSDLDRYRNAHGDRDPDAERDADERQPPIATPGQLYDVPTLSNAAL